MSQKHVAFCLEPAYGHIIPTLGIASELLRRGHRVSYAVTDRFVPAIHKIGATAKTIRAVETREKLMRSAARSDGSYEFSGGLTERFERLREERTAEILPQLENLYLEDVPDLVIHDDTSDVAGREFALKNAIPRIRHMPAMILGEWIKLFENDRLVLVSVPKFLNKGIDGLDNRFEFIGFLPEGRNQFFEPWQRTSGNKNSILVSTTTGLLPPIEFCKLVIDSFRSESWPVVLSIPGDFDPNSRIDPGSLGELPENFRLNRASANFEILESACLFVGQGGQGSTLEAMYWGVPLIIVPPTRVHDVLACRVAELGLGARLQNSDVSAENLRTCAAHLMADIATLDRVRQVQQIMHEDRGAERAGQLIDEYLL